jgi:hypothetical protein
MDHVAIMNKSLGFLEKILKREKIIESRWYSSKRSPWDRISRGDTVYFKNSGEQVIAKSKVSKVLQFENLDPEKVKKILVEFGSSIGISEAEYLIFFNLFKDKKYCILIFLDNVQEMTHFQIDKKGFGMQSAWITIDNINQIKKS